MFGKVLETWGARLATKDDLDRTTRLVQSIQSEFNIRTDGQLFIVEQKRKACVDLFNSCWFWKHFLAWNRLSYVVSKGKTAIDQWEISFHDFARRAEQSRVSFDLFITDASLKAAALKMFEDIDKFSRIQFDQWCDMSNLYFSHGVDWRKYDVLELEQLTDLSQGKDKTQTSIDSYSKECRRYLEHL